MDATKSTFVKLFTNIQKGENPANIRLAALKIAYDEACAIALPSSENIDSPFDRDRLQEPEETEETVESAAPVVIPAEDTGCEAEEEAAQEETVSEELPAEETEAKPEEPEKGDVDLNVSVGGAAAAAAVAEEEPEYNIVLNEQESDISATQVIDVDVEYNETDIEDTEDESQEDNDEETEKVKAKGSPVLVILNIILVIILLWLVYGLLRTFDILPSGLNFDLGYSWFNSTIYPIF